MMAPKRQLEKLRCVGCLNGLIRVEEEAFRCESCGILIDSIEGVPFLGSYESADLLGLIEIAAVKEVGTAIDEDSVERVELLCQGYFESGEGDDWLKSQEDPFASAYWFPYRYSEWRDSHLVAEGVEWEGAEVLDVGAGVGYDAIRYLKRGSRVTGFEYNPASIERGILSVPGACWVGGFSHLLPFKDEQFDVICANAALHHMRDVRQAFREMFRALKPGGSLLTSGDPFRPFDSSEQYELKVFDSHPAVLGGVNEGIPNLQVFLDPVAEFGESVTGFAITHALQQLPGGVESIDMGKGYRRWKLEDLPALGGTSGSIAFHLRKHGPINLVPAVQTEEVIRPRVYHDAIGDVSKTMALICPVLPDEAVNRPLLPDEQSFFDLLNGWKAPRRMEGWRRGYGRGRWFLEKEGGLAGVSFRLGASGKKSSEFDFFVNGESVAKEEVKGGGTSALVNFLTKLRQKCGSSSFQGRVISRLCRCFPSRQPRHQCEVILGRLIHGRVAFEIRNLNADEPEFTVKDRVLL
ncbi:MAG: class I SAM-dependent methyltransferase [Verrucomicrobiota bacterium]